MTIRKLSQLEMIAQLGLQDQIEELKLLEASQPIPCASRPEISDYRFSSSPSPWSFRPGVPSSMAPNHRMCNYSRSFPFCRPRSEHSSQPRILPSHSTRALWYVGTPLFNVSSTYGQQGSYFPIVAALQIEYRARAVPSRAPDCFIPLSTVG
jgi:hypothetical protein